MFSNFKIHIEVDDVIDSTWLHRYNYFYYKQTVEINEQIILFKNNFNFSFFQEQFQIFWIGDNQIKQC